MGQGADGTGFRNGGDEWNDGGNVSLSLWERLCTSQKRGPPSEGIGYLAMLVKAVQPSHTCQVFLSCPLRGMVSAYHTGCYSSSGTFLGTVQRTGIFPLLPSCNKGSPNSCPVNHLKECRHRCDPLVTLECVLGFFIFFHFSSLELRMSSVILLKLTFSTSSYYSLAP